MAKKEVLITVNYAQETPVSLKELCEICSVSTDYVHELITYEIIRPQGEELSDWTFDLRELTRIKRALRLQHDLEVNLAGIAIVLDLLDEIEELRAHAKLLEKHFFK